MTIAEKSEAMVKLGFLNSRMKESIPLSFCDVTGDIKSFLTPVIALIKQQN